MHRHRREDVVERRRVAEGTARLVDVRLELAAELVDVARDRDRGRLAERTQALAVDAVADIEASLLVTGPRAFLLYPNYSALLQYNCAHAYALSVGLLSDRVGREKGTSHPTKNAPPTEPKTKTPKETKPTGQ